MSCFACVPNQTSCEIIVTHIMKFVLDSTLLCNLLDYNNKYSPSMS